MSNSEKRISEINTSYSPVRFSPEGLSIPEGVKRAFPSLKRAMDAMHGIYLRQQREGLAEELEKKRNLETELGTFYRMFQGPWYPVENYKSYDSDIADRDPRCSFYPRDGSRGVPSLR